MADIKERRKDAGSIKEKRTSAPKELLKQETIHSIQWARQQVQEAAESEQQESEGAGAGMPRLSVPQIKRHSRSKLKHETYDTPTTASKSTTESSIMSTGTAVESAPSRVQEAYAHAQDQCRKRKGPKKSRNEWKMHPNLILCGNRNPRLLHGPILFGKTRPSTLILQVLFGKGPFLHLFHLL